jgi:uncharacterized protein YdaU (DUF1376 family)
MPLWIADYLADTMHLTTRQHGEYLLLLMFSWKQDRPLPKADAALRAIARASEEEWAEDKETVLAFFDEGQGGYTQARLERERVKAVARYNAQAVRSAAGVAARQAHKVPEVEPEVRPEVKLEADTTHNSHISKDIKDMYGSVAPDGYPSDFEQFWKAYPRTPNMSKSAALKSWKQQKSHLPPLPDLLSSVAKYRAFLDAETKKQGRAYPAKHAQGWITERRWEGYISQAQAETTVATAAPDWADDNPKWAAFKRSLPPTAWANFFAVCRPNGSESTLIAPTAFVRDQIESRYGSSLFAVFNDFKVKVSPP